MGLKMHLYVKACDFVHSYVKASTCDFSVLTDILTNRMKDIEKAKITSGSG